MMDAAKWAVPLGLVVFSATPGYAIHYLAVDEAQRACFPGADQFVVSHVVFTPAQIQRISALSGQTPMARGQQVWKAMKGGKLLGWLVVDYVIGKHLAIDYAVALSPTGSVSSAKSKSWNTARATAARFTARHGANNSTARRPPRRSS